MFVNRFYDLSQTKSNIYKILYLPTVTFLQYLQFDLRKLSLEFNVTESSRIRASPSGPTCRVKPTLSGKWKLVPLTTTVNAREEPDGSTAVCIVFRDDGYLNRGLPGLGGGASAPQNTAEFTGPIEHSRMNKQNVYTSACHRK